MADNASLILVIEDDRRLQEDLLIILELEGYEAFAASNGREGLLAARRRRPDLILSDISMPVLDGLSMMIELQDDPLTCRIPVIFLSAHSEPAVVRRGQQLGAVGFVRKPCDLDELLMTIEAQLGATNADTQANSSLPPGQEPTMTECLP